MDAGWLHRGGMKQRRHYKCRSCGDLYRPDYRNAHHQRFCDRPACRAQSKATSQRRWRAKPENYEADRGSAHVERVRQWRKANPGYWRRKSALREICEPQVVAPQATKHELVAEISDRALPLHNLCLAQDALFIGLMSHITGALRENIALQIARFQAHGQMILGKGPGIGT